jgi:hypothetical protein
MPSANPTWRTIMNSAAPRVSVTLRHNGKPIAAAKPGSTIAIEVKVQHKHPGPLHYRWTSDSAGLVAADAPSVTMTLPSTAFAPHIFVEISNGKGGFLDLAITVPVKTPASQPPGPFLKIMGDNANLFSILNDNAGL